MASGGQLIVVVGLAFEARIAKGPGIRVICSSGTGDLAEALSRACQEGGRSLISFGVAGGLDPELKPGACVVGSAILSGEARLDTDRGWSQRLLQAIPGAVHGVIAGVPAPVAHPDAKRAIHLKTGAMAVDMESHIVAGVAAAHGLPMAAIRVITDPAARALPAAALAAMGPNGATDIPAMVRTVLRRPRELPALLRTALDARAARATLLRGRQALGPNLGFGELQEA
jgi:adenosylhomocysteine nucleosidase